MDRVKIGLLAAFLLIGAALVFVFRKPKKPGESMADKMAAVRAAKAAKRYVEQEEEQETEQENDNETIKNITGANA
jgi:Sec-independent protein translocase protein TatA